MKIKKLLLYLFGVGIAIFVVGGVIRSAPLTNPSRFWNVTAVDTVKYSRDAAGDTSVLQKIPLFMTEAQRLHVTHVAIDTPYDKEFYPVLKAWVDEARKHNLKVWFRGNFSGWEGWFGYQKFTSIDEHNQLTRQFVQNHPDLFQNGDIFTPIPEPENGGPGDPRGSDQKSADFNATLISSYNNCVTAFGQIHKQILCGFFSTNGDIANTILTTSTVAKIGNIVVIDHYVDSAQGMQNELNILSQKFPDAKVVLGEFGAPIPDINGTMSETTQAVFINSLLQVFYQNRAIIAGLDYWTLSGGSTSLLKDDYSEKAAFATVASWFLPSQLMGRVVNTLGVRLENVAIEDPTGHTVTTSGQDGTFSLAIGKRGAQTLVVHAVGYKPFQQTVSVTGNQQKLEDIQLTPENPDFFYRMRLFFKRIFSF